jgi:heterodisulfide reductase subunit A-like polyferredoxin
MGMVKVGKIELPSLPGPDGDAPVFQGNILVVGGCVSGMTAAWKRQGGYQVTLVEQEAQLGGVGAKLRKSTRLSSYLELEDTAWMS